MPGRRDGHDLALLRSDQLQCGPQQAPFQDGGLCRQHLGQGAAGPAAAGQRAVELSSCSHPVGWTAVAWLPSSLPSQRPGRSMPRAAEGSAWGLETGRGTAAMMKL